MAEDTIQDAFKRNDPNVIKDGPFGSERTVASPSELASGLQRRMMETFSGLDSRTGITPEDLPEQWGGRPTGTSRRAIRMQKEWDDRRNRQIQEYNIQREAYENDRSFGLQMRDQAIQEADFQMRQEERVADQKIEYERKTQAANISRILNTLNPKSPTYQDDVARVVGENPLGVTDESVAKVLQRYDAVNEIYRNSEKSQSSISKEVDDEIAKAVEAGVTLDQIEQTKTRSGYDIGMLKRITAEAKYGASEEDKGFKMSERNERLRLAAVEAETMASEYGDGDSEEAQKLKATAAAARAKYDEAVKGSEEREKKASEPRIRKFNSIEEAEAAGLDSGTIVDIGGRKARID